MWQLDNDNDGFAVLLEFNITDLTNITSPTKDKIKPSDLEDIYLQKGVKQERLIELLGHTPIQVFIGAALGVMVAIISYR